MVVWTVDRGERLGVRDVEGTEVHYLPTPLPAKDFRALARFAGLAPPAWRHWLQAHRDFRPDLLHVHCFGPNGLYALGLHQRYSTPLVLTSHGETFMDDHGVFDGSALLRWGLRRGLRRAVATTVPSSAVRNDLQTRFKAGTCEVVPNGVDLDEHASQASTSALPSAWPRSRIVVALGRVERIKGFDLLLQAFAQVAKPGEHLVIAGDGSQLAALRTLVTDLGISDSVTFVGRLDRPGVNTVMRAADVVVVPSRVEAFGIVALEAWRAGTPLVMTRHGGAADFIIDHENGLLVDPEDTAAVGAAIRTVLEDDITARRLAASGREAVRRFSWDRVARDYEAIYDRVLSQ